MFVGSVKANAKIKSVNTTEALKMTGVLGYINHKDIPGDNKGIFATNDV